MLGDEGLIGQQGCYTSTCACLSSVKAFKLQEEGLLTLASMLKYSRKCALVNMERLRFSSVDRHEVEMNLYANIESIRRCTAFRNQFRGVLSQANGVNQQQLFLNSSIKSQDGGSKLLSNASIRKIQSLVVILKKKQAIFQMRTAQVCNNKFTVYSFHEDTKVFDCKHRMFFYQQS
jgi:hypothetical protein